MPRNGTALLVFSFMALCGAAATRCVADEAQSPDEPSARPQIDLRLDISESYPHARKISFAVVTVPDPRVPRYRRLYDLTIEALQLGMLSKSYVLDRWAVPWAHTARKLSGHRPELPNYGLMVFRCDSWRDANKLTGHSCNDQSGLTAVSQKSSVLSEARLRVVYLVPETATQGVEYDGLCQSVKRIGEQLRDDPSPSITDCSRNKRPADPPEGYQPGAAGYTGLMSFPSSACEPFQSTLVILGPMFSGSLDSIRSRRTELLHDRPAIRNICLISSSATVISNDWWTMARRERAVEVCRVASCRFHRSPLFTTSRWRFRIFKSSPKLPLFQMRSSRKARLFSSANPRFSASAPATMYAAQSADQAHRK